MNLTFSVPRNFNLTRRGSQRPCFPEIWTSSQNHGLDFQMAFSGVPITSYGTGMSNSASTELGLLPPALREQARCGGFSRMVGSVPLGVQG